MKIYPIATLDRVHQGRVVLIDIKQWVCKGQWGRLWGAHEGPATSGTDNPQALRDCGFTHYALLSEIEEEERGCMIESYGTLTKAEEEGLAIKYGRSSETVSPSTNHE